MPPGLTPLAMRNLLKVIHTLAIAGASEQEPPKKAFQRIADLCAPYLQNGGKA